EAGTQGRQHLWREVLVMCGPAGQAAEDEPSRPKRGSAEEDPTQTHEVKGEEERDRAPPERSRTRAGARPPLRPEAIDRQPHAVERSPDDERPGGAVPQAAEQHGDEQVQVGAGRPTAVAAERDVEVVAQPRRQTDVPAAPELGD